MRARSHGRRIRKFSVNPLFFVVMGVFFVVEHSLFAAAVLGAALIHEAGHVAAALAMGGTIAELRLLPFGVSMRLEGGLLLGYRRDAIIALSGPAANLLALGAFAAAARVMSAPPRLFAYFILADLGLCLVNLIPALPLDGGRALEALLLSALSPWAARVVMLVFSITFTGLVFASGLWLLAATGYNASLLFIAVYLAAFLVTKNRLEVRS